ncbi:MAG: hypothetical protein ACPF8V_04845, partial [Luteibaculum sp.]
MLSSSRRAVLVVLFLVIGIIFIIRLFTLQVLDNDFKIQAANMSERRVIQYPARGIIS